MNLLHNISIAVASSEAYFQKIHIIRLIGLVCTNNSFVIVPLPCGDAAFKFKTMQIKFYIQMLVGVMRGVRHVNIKKRVLRMNGSI